MCQRAGCFYKLTRARAHVYILGKCWHAGTLLTATPLCTPLLLPQKSTIVKICHAATLSRLFRGSAAGLPRVEGTSTPPQKGSIVKIYPLGCLLVLPTQKRLPNSTGQTAARLGFYAGRTRFTYSVYASVWGAVSLRFLCSFTFCIMLMVRKGTRNIAKNTRVSITIDKSIVVVFNWLITS